MQAALKPSGPQHDAKSASRPPRVARQVHTSAMDRNLPRGSSSCTAPAASACLKVRVMCVQRPCRGTPAQHVACAGREAVMSAFTGRGPDPDLHANHARHVPVQRKPVARTCTTSALRHYCSSALQEQGQQHAQNLPPPHIPPAARSAPGRRSATWLSGSARLDRAAKVAPGVGVLSRAVEAGGPLRPAGLAPVQAAAALGAHDADHFLRAGERTGSHPDRRGWHRRQCKQSLHAFQDAACLTTCLKQGSKC